MSDNRKIPNTTPTSSPKILPLADPQTLLIHVQEIKQRDSLEKSTLYLDQNAPPLPNPLDGHPLDNPPLDRSQPQSALEQPTANNSPRMPPISTQAVKSTLEDLWKTLPGANPRVFSPYDSSSSESDIKPTKRKAPKNPPMNHLALPSSTATTASNTPTSLLSPISSNAPSKKEEEKEKDKEAEKESGKSLCQRCGFF